MTENTVKVLLVEDNDGHAELLKILLHSSGDLLFELTRCSTLAQGLQFLGKDSVEGPFELILLDLTLPDSSNLETFNRVKAFAPHLPIIILTGLDDEAMAVLALQRGAQDYLVKGRVDSVLLGRSMRYALERARIQSELRKSYAELDLRVRIRTAELSETNRKLSEEIGERRRVEDAYRESNLQLAEAVSKLRETQQSIIQRERLHALGRMASGIAHDFNNSLAPILGFSELLLLKEETLADTGKVRSFLEMIHDAAEDSAKVVSRLREFYRYREESDLFGPVSFNDVIHSVVAMLKPRWKDQAQIEGIDITVKTELQELPPLTGNEDQLREMLANLITNSIDSISKEGTILLRTSTRNKKVFLQVSDTGSGMTEEVRARCLEPFFSTKREAGTGLGLGIVYGTIRRHDGEITIESRVNKGTTVTVSLALDHEKPKEEKVAEIPQCMPPLKILLVEDEPLVRDVIEAYLSEDAHTVQSAGNGKEGLEKFKAGTFDVVLTDRAMPEMNGDKLAIEIKRISPMTPVLLLTGFSDMMGKSNRPEGVDLVIGKPFTMTSLRDGIAKVYFK